MNRIELNTGIFLMKVVLYLCTEICFSVRVWKTPCRKLTERSHISVEGLAVNGSLLCFQSRFLSFTYIELQRIVNTQAFCFAVTKWPPSSLEMDILSACFHKLEAFFSSRVAVGMRWIVAGVLSVGKLMRHCWYGLQVKRDEWCSCEPSSDVPRVWVPLHPSAVHFLFCSTLAIQELLPLIKGMSRKHLPRPELKAEQLQNSGR